MVSAELEVSSEVHLSAFQLSAGRGRQEQTNFDPVHEPEVGGQVRILWLRL